MNTEASRERALRHKLDRAGYRLHKTPARSWLRAHYGPGYMITENNTVVFGCCGRSYSATLEEVEDFIDWGLNDESEAPISSEAK